MELTITEKILKLTQSIRDNSENELCFGTLRTLDMIDSEAKLISSLVDTYEREAYKHGRMEAEMNAEDAIEHGFLTRQ